MAALTHRQQQAIVAGMAQTTTECCCGGAPCASLDGSCCRLCPCVNGPPGVNDGTGNHYWLAGRTASLRLQSADLAAMVGYSQLYQAAELNPNGMDNLPACWAGQRDTSTGNIVGTGEPIDLSFVDILLELGGQTVFDPPCCYEAYKSFAKCGGILTIGIRTVAGDEFAAYGGGGYRRDNALWVEWYAGFDHPLLTGNSAFSVGVPFTYSNLPTVMFLQKIHAFPNPDYNPDYGGDPTVITPACFECPLIMSGQSLSYMPVGGTGFERGWAIGLTSPGNDDINTPDLFQSGDPRVNWSFRLNCGTQTVNL